MKILTVSDLHFEFHADGGASFVAGLPKDLDILIVAGDLSISSALLDALTLLSQAFKRVIFVPGNHDWYQGTRERLQTIREQVRTRAPNVTWLDRDVVEIEGRRFVGTTLWYPDTPLARRWTMKTPDFREIIDLKEWIWTEFELDRKFLSDNVRPGDIVITHYLPAPASIARKWVGQRLNCYFLGNVEHIVKSAGARFWFHGHTHSSCDYMLGKTRVLCNPFGYTMALNQEFRDDLCIEI